STCCPICSSCVACRVISGPTTFYVGNRRGEIGNRSLVADWCQRSPFNVIQAASAVKEKALIHSEHRVHDTVHRPLPFSTRDANPSGRPEHYLQGRGCALTAPTERGSPAWHRPFDEGPII